MCVWNGCYGDLFIAMCVVTMEINWGSGDRGLLNYTEVFIKLRELLLLSNELGY